MGFGIEAVCVRIVKETMYRDNENAEAGGLNLRRVAGIRHLDAKRERPHRCWRSRNVTTRVELRKATLHFSSKRGATSERSEARRASTFSRASRAKAALRRLAMT